MNQFKISTFNPYTIIIFLITVVLFFYSVFLNYSVIQDYHNSKVINVVKSTTNHKCTYNPDILMLSDTMCTTYNNVYYMLYPKQGSFDGLYYGLRTDTTKNICNGLCKKSDYYTIIDRGTDYISTKNLTVISSTNSDSSGMIVSVTLKDGLVTDITFVNIGTKYDLESTLEIVNPNVVGTNCLFILRDLPTKGCSNTNALYNQCLTQNEPDDNCSNNKPMVNIKQDSGDDLSFYPNIVLEKPFDTPAVPCVLTKFNN